MASITGTNISWRRLPADIWLEILQLLMKDGASCATLACVSRDWQAVVEPPNFARIKLTPSRLVDFDSMTYRNRHLVKYLWLCLELQKWDPRHSDVANADNILIDTSFQSLFSTLTTWEPDVNMTLDISVYSPSDAEGGFEYLTFQPDLLAADIDTGIHTDNGTEEIEQLPTPPRFHISALFGALLNEHPNYGRWNYPDSFEKVMYICAQNDLLTDLEPSTWELVNAVHRQFRHELSSWRGLPSVPVVTSVLLRQQTRRRWHLRRLLELFSFLPRLREIHYEPWREWREPDQSVQDGYWKKLLLSSPPTLRKLVLFENFNPQFAALVGDNTPRTPNPIISQALAKISLDFESLSASYLVDAGFFFDSCESSWVWPNLTSIALTSQLLRPDANAQEINVLFQAAVKVTRRMPKLENLEIWNGQRGLAALFRFEPKNATLAWKATWELNIPTEIQAWTEAAPSHRCKVTKELLDSSLINSHIDAIKILKLTSPVLRPVSLQQLQTELEHWGRLKGP